MTTAACGGGDGDREDAASAQDGPKPLTEAQLSAAALSDGDLRAYTAHEPYGGDAPLSDAYTAKPEVCRPLVSLTKGATPYDPVAEVVRTVSDLYADPSVDTDVHLRSYTAPDAAAVMAALGEAGEKCADGFTEERSLTEAKIVEVETVEAPAHGDEAHAFRIVSQDVEDPAIELYE